MAEQVSHNVVNHLESTSGSPLVDAAASQTTANSADSGTPARTSPIHPQSKHFESSESAHESENTANESVHIGQAGSDATRTAAEPSAGDVADGFAKDSASYVGERHGDLEDASAGDGHLDDRSTADVSVDFSVNSDTDTSRADAGEKKDSGHRLRTNSVKKPATFSKVSVTKNFMAKTATAAPVAPKAGEKATTVSAVLQPTAKPRLVAKSAGSSLRNLQKARSGPDGAGGPDASKVWNKNRPVQPPPPRHFTDEELKQQYGIHLATRLQTDEGGKESKWADIDDDEDDWTPETVVWMDGTKSTITPQDAMPPEKEQKPEATPPSKPADAVKPTLTSMKRPDQNMTILKPGSAAAGQGKQAGFATPSPGPDKPSLKVKGTLAIPLTKSPWAPVPKIESISPVNPPVQQPQSRPQMAPQDARAYEPASVPATREIAADTFDRSWREGEGGTRELFNSASGRYEPAPDGRPNSIRLDASTRKPAVLQRPMQGGAPPAEPSPAFQGRSGSQLDGTWGRRRGSSVSQGSVPPARRLSTSTRVSELPTAVEDTDDADIPKAPAVTSDARIDSGRPEFSQQSTWSQQMPPQPVPGDEPPPTPMEDALKRQDRVMREKRELAIKRRQEEEAREEAAKQERLKAKLAALEDAGKSRKEREAEAAAAAAAATTATATATSPVDQAIKNQTPTSVPGEKAERHSEATQPAHVPAAAAPAVEAQPLAPTAGQASSTQASPHQQATLPSPLPPKSQPSAVPERPSSSSDVTQRQTQRAHMSPRSSARAPYQPPQAATYKGSASSYSSPGERKQQPYGRSPIPNESAFTPWPTTAPSGNVWGTAGIGNGTFENSSSYAPVPMSQQGSSLPPPPGMPRPATSARISPQGFAQGSRSPGLQQSQPVEQQRAFPPPGIESRPDPFNASTRLAGMSPVPGLSRPAHPPGPIGPPSRSQQQQQTSQRQDPITMWNQAAQRLPSQYTADAQAAFQRRKQDALAPEPPKRTFKETFKQTATDTSELGSVPRYKTSEHTVHTGHGTLPETAVSPAPPNVQTIAPFSNVPSVTDSWKQPATNQVNVPENAQGVIQGGMPPQHAPIGPPTTQQPPVVVNNGVKFTAAPLPPALEIEGSTPPPPETETHPVNSGDHSHPLVKLPPPQAKVKLPPKAQVKLPPASPAALPQAALHSTPVMMPQRPYSGWAPPGVTKPIVMNEAWQARFNGLFNRTPIQTETPPSPPKTPPKMQGPTLAVTSSSRALMDYQAGIRTGSATVSLPQIRKSLSLEGFVLDDSSDVFSKPTIDHVFNEELSFGSLPRINIPRNTAYNTSVYPPNARNLLSMSSNSKMIRSIDSQSVPEFERERFYKHKDGIFVRLLGTKLDNRLVRHDALNNAARRPSAIKNTSKFSKFRLGKDTNSASPSTPSAGPRKTTPSNATSGNGVPEDRRKQGSSNRYNSRGTSLTPGVNNNNSASSTSNVRTQSAATAKSG